MYLYFILATLPAAPYGLKEAARCVLAFSDPQFSFFILCLECPPNFSCRGKDTRREDRKRNTLTEGGGGCLAGRGSVVKWGECCSCGGGGIMVHCESLLSNGAFSHQHRPHWVCGARVYWGVSASERGREGGREGATCYNISSHNICISIHSWLTKHHHVNCL